MAELLGFQRGHISRLEAGMRYPSRSFLRLLVGLPNVTPEEHVRILIFEEMRECHAGESEVCCSYPSRRL
jgi:transcriptional regulator with XRE-family HTH domain